MGVCINWGKMERGRTAGVREAQLEGLWLSEGSSSVAVYILPFSSTTWPVVVRCGAASTERQVCGYGWGGETWC